MVRRDRIEGTPGTPGDPDHEIAADAAAMGESEISRSTGTGSAGSGLATTGDQGIGRTTHAASTAPATNRKDVGDARNPSSADSGGTGTAGSGPGRASAAGTPSAGTTRGGSGGGGRGGS